MRLFRIAKDLNIEIQTLVDFLQKKCGINDVSPTFIISERLFDIIVKEFDRDNNCRKYKSEYNNDNPDDSLYVPITVHKLSQKYELQVSSLLKCLDEKFPQTVGWNINSVVGKEQFKQICLLFRHDIYIKKTQTGEFEDPLDKEFREKSIAKSVETNMKESILPIVADYYVIDTNVFVDHPSILGFFPKESTIIVPGVVIDELDHLKTKYKQESREHININRAAKEILKNDRICRVLADKTYLPVDFNYINPNEDSLILAVALKHQATLKNAKTVVVTSDTYMQVRCQYVGLAYMNPDCIINSKQ